MGPPRCVLRALPCRTEPAYATVLCCTLHATCRRMVTQHGINALCYRYSTVAMCCAAVGCGRRRCGQRRFQSQQRRGAGDDGYVSAALRCTVLHSTTLLEVLECDRVLYAAKPFAMTDCTTRRGDRIDSTTASTTNAKACRQTDRHCIADQRVLTPVGNSIADCGR